MYKCTIGNDLKENPKSSFQFNLISCIYIIFVNIEKQESRFFIVITVLRKWALEQNLCLPPLMLCALLCFIHSDVSCNYLAMITIQSYPNKFNFFKSILDPTSCRKIKSVMKCCDTIN